MKKDFDGWNREKKRIDRCAKAPSYREREVRFGTNVGFEEDGTGSGRSRPVLILKSFSREVCIIIPLTKSSKQNKYYYPLGTLGGAEAYAIISQIKLIDTKRLYWKIGDLDHSTFGRIRKAVKDML